MLSTSTSKSLPHTSHKYSQRPHLKLCTSGTRHNRSTETLSLRRITTGIGGSDIAWKPNDSNRHRQYKKALNVLRSSSMLLSLRLGRSIDRTKNLLSAALSIVCPYTLGHCDGILDQGALLSGHTQNKMHRHATEQRKIYIDSLKIPLCVLCVNGWLSDEVLEYLLI